MSKKILISAEDPNETRVAVVEDEHLVDFDSEVSSHKPIRGNIYLGKVVRVEPSLQAVFVEYMDGKNGFLPFSEIHPDYYRIPVSDRDDKDNENVFEENKSNREIVAYPNSVEVKDEKPVKQKKKKRKYNIQEVIHTKQVLLVQIIKDERGTKGAALTTYLSLAGQYCVLMPNSGDRNGGISKKINKDDDRKRLKDLMNDMEIPEKMSVIIRTAGQERKKAEIKKDYEYLIRLWNDIRKKTIESNAPQLINEEACILMRSIRDFYKKEVDEIIVDSKEAYKKLREYMKKLSSSSVKKIKLYKDEDVSLFNHYDIEQQLLDMVSPRVELPSGGSIVIGQTEALVAIDVNSGKSTKEKHIDTTALKTNLEAAKEIARQLRLRDLSGLIVIDFIDMNDNKHIQQVEKAFKLHTKSDSAKVQISNISQFGLLEMSRQRIRSSILETYSAVCPHCQGRGVTYSKTYFLSTVMHILEKVAFENNSEKFNIYIPNFICNDLLNTKRKEIFEVEKKYNCSVYVTPDYNLSDIDFVIDSGNGALHQFSLGKTKNLEEDGVSYEKLKNNNVKQINNKNNHNVTNNDQQKKQNDYHGKRRRKRNKSSAQNNNQQNSNDNDKSSSIENGKKTNRNWLRKIFKN